MSKAVYIPRGVAENTTPITGVSNAYNSARFHKINLARFPELKAEGRPTGNFFGELDVLIIQCSALSSGPAPQQIHYMLSTGEAGDNIIFGANTGELSINVVDTSKGATSYRIEAPLFIDGDDTVYLWYKTDQGTLTVDKTTVLWHE